MRMERVLCPVHSILKIFLDISSIKTLLLLLVSSYRL